MGKKVVAYSLPIWQYGPRRHFWTTPPRRPLPPFPISLAAAGANWKRREKQMLIRLKDIHTEPEFTVPFEARWTTVAGDELQIVMHRSQLEDLADEIEAVLGDLPAEEDEASSSKVAAPDPIHEIIKEIGANKHLWKGAA